MRFEVQNRYWHILQTRYFLDILTIIGSGIIILPDFFGAISTFLLMPAQVQSALYHCSGMKGVGLQI